VFENNNAEEYGGVIYIPNKLLSLKMILGFYLRIANLKIIQQKKVMINKIK